MNPPVFLHRTAIAPSGAPTLSSPDDRDWSLIRAPPEVGVSVKKRTFYRTSVLLDLPIAALPAGGRHPRPSTPGSLCTSSAHLPSPVELLTAVSKALWPPASSPHGLPPGPKNSAHPRLLDLLPPQAVHAWCHPSFCRPGPHCSRCAKSTCFT